MIDSYTVGLAVVGATLMLTGMGFGLGVGYLAAMRRYAIKFPRRPRR